MARIASLPAPVRPADLAAVRQLLKEWTLESYLCSKPPSTVVCLSDDMTVGQVQQASRLLHLHIIRLCLETHQDYSEAIDDGVAFHHRAERAS